ncbi:MAG: trypsin-like peptidase domain-containing protein [Terrimicrobiaceae bacterium]|nr:trypsin-like peptidase domain-containing protein [Terrimicrobiaceae bacterium]
MICRFIFSVGCALAMEVAAVAQNTTPASNSHDLARSLSTAFADVYEHVSPGVVVIEAQPDAAPTGNPMASQLNQFFRQAPDDTPSQPGETNQGSGFVITADGYILTNNHVLEDSTQHVKVTLKDGRKFDAQVVGADPISDLAVLKIKAANLPVVELGDSDRTRVGEFAFALGAPYDLRNSFTYGVVSAKGRTDITGSANYEEYLQTDASINPGNSGGPLVDIDGRVIGVNTLIRDLNRGLGFAIPINIAKKVATQLISQGRATRPWLGIEIAGVEELSRRAWRYPDLAVFLQRHPDLPKGIVVLGIEAGTPASQSDLRQLDVITSVDGKQVSSSRELQKVIFDKNVGQEVSLHVWRNGRAAEVKLRAAEHTDGLIPVANQRVDPAPSAQPPLPPSPTAGLTVRTLTAETALAMKLQPEEGVLVTSVEPGSAAANAGVLVGDVITSVGTTAVRTRADFMKALASASGDGVMLNINRGDEKTYEILKL